MFNIHIYIINTNNILIKRVGFEPTLAGIRPCFKNCHLLFPTFPLSGRVFPPHRRFHQAIILNAHAFHNKKLYAMILGFCCAIAPAHPKFHRQH